MDPDIFRRTDYTTGQVASALGEDRQTITDTMRRGALRSYTAGSHARLSFAQAVSIGIARTLVNGGASVFVSANVARHADIMMPAFIETLAKCASSGVDPLTPGGAADADMPVFVALVRHDDGEGGEAITVGGKITAADNVSEFVSGALKGRTTVLRGVVPLIVVVPLLPIIRRLVAWESRS